VRVQGGQFAKHGQWFVYNTEVAPHFFEREFNGLDGREPIWTKLFRDPWNPFDPL